MSIEHLTVAVAGVLGIPTVNPSNIYYLPQGRGPLSTLHGLFHLILSLYAPILQMKKPRLGEVK